MDPPSCPCREYYDYIESQLNKTGPKLPAHTVGNLKTVVKNKLLSQGWEFWLTDKKTHLRGIIDELRYTRPDNKTYISLSTACKGYLEWQQMPELEKRRIRKVPAKLLAYKRAREGALQLSDLTDYGSQHSLVVKEVHCQLVRQRPKKRAQKVFKVSDLADSGGQHDKVLEDVHYQLKQPRPAKRARKVSALSDPNSIDMSSPQCQFTSYLQYKIDRSGYVSDDICSVCTEGGTLMICDHCPSVFHPKCVGLEEVPEGDWYCASCLCEVCGSSEYSLRTEKMTDKTVLSCEQCERKYHIGCLQERELERCPMGNWLCSTSCFKIFYTLQNLVGKSTPISEEGLKWTLLRCSRETVANLQFERKLIAKHHKMLLNASGLLHECFYKVFESRTKSDMIVDLLFNKQNELDRLNFRGFYTMLLEKEKELISVATFRVHGNKVAEMPFIGTRHCYRRQGMCRLLVEELTKVLSELGVERLVLPAIPDVLSTWTDGFNFTKLTSSEIIELSRYTFVKFPGSTMCQKVLGKSITVSKDQIRVHN